VGTNKLFTFNACDQRPKCLELILRIFIVQLYIMLLSHYVIIFYRHTKYCRQNNGIISPELIKLLFKTIQVYMLFKPTFPGFPLLPISEFRYTVDGTQEDLPRMWLTEIFVLSTIQQSS